MARKLIAFTITNPGNEDYKKIHETIKRVTNSWAKIDETLFLTITEKSSVNLRDIINKVNIEGVLKNILVTDWSHPLAWNGYSDDISNWIKNN